MTKQTEALRMAIEVFEQEESTWFDTTDMAKAYQACKEALEQPAQEPVAWINVKDKLPKETGRYLVYVEAIHDLGNAHYIWNAGFNPNDRVFQEETMEGATVTHWMNLPNTPNGISHYIDPSHPAPSWQGLSDDEIGRLAVFDGLHHVEIPLLAKFILAIEQALKEKNDK